MPLRIGVHHHVAHAPPRTRTAVEDTAALLSMHGHRVLDLAAGRSLLDRLRDRAALDSVEVLVHLPGLVLGERFPCTATVTVGRGPGAEPVGIAISARPGLAGQVRGLARLVLLDQPALTTATVA
ncbi:hypothetical protein ACTG9Q_10305 [Actinokineospora sp. 24-640]